MFQIMISLLPMSQSAFAAAIVGLLSNDARRDSLGAEGSCAG